MGGVVAFLFYGSILFCLIGSSIKITGFIKTPLHLKWEYYKGSSVYESIDWWTRAPTGFREKVVTALVDIIFLREYYRRNPQYWFFLYLFHLGIYLLILWHIWLFAASVLPDPEGTRGYGLAWGHGATILACIGTLGILILRITDRELRLYYAPLHYIKWVLMMITLAGGFYAVHVYFGGSIPAVLKYVRAQVTFSDTAQKFHPPPATAAHVLLGSVWLVYLPFSHILRLFFRYYHGLRFDEVPNVPGGIIEKRVKELLGKPVTWAGPHIRSGKSWRETATGLPDEEGKGKAG
ncbi:MAG: hypothetical protein A4E65_02966 [Syntrophorhabdus sp. PtaU1.Bin153]|nr:MAG: hypothetical protein A4E65_02966 [Syntrophorhabdus sp. PtaU1.Bin153]